jgi:hypothetical protein
MRTMIEWFEELSLAETSACVAALSALVTVFVWATFRRRYVRWSAILVGPFLVGAGVYSLPVWIGADPAEYSHWAGLFIGVWGLAGVCASAFTGIVWTVLNRGSAQ